VIVRMNVELKKAKISKEGGCYILSSEWEVSQSDNIIALRYKDTGVLKITSEGEILYNSSSEVILEKSENFIKLGDILIRFFGFDVVVELNNDFAIEFQGFLESGFAIDLA